MNDNLPSDTKIIIDVLREENDRLKREVARYEKTLKSYDIEEVDDMSDVEYICVEEIKKLRLTSDTRPLTDFEVKNLDVLHKNLKSARGQSSEKKKVKEKPVDVNELLSIVNNDKEQA